MVFQKIKKISFIFLLSTVLCSQNSFSNYFITVFNENKITVRSALTGEKLAQITGEEDEKFCAVSCFSDGAYFAVANNKKEIKIWAILKIVQEIKLKPVKTILSDCVMVKLFFEPQGKYLFSKNLINEITIWDTFTWDKINVPKFDKLPYISLAFSVDGRYLALQSFAGCRSCVKCFLCNIEIFETGTWKKVKTFLFEDSLKKIYSCMTFGPNNLFAIGCKNGDVVIWDFENPRKPKLLRKFRVLSGDVTALSFSHDGCWLASGGLCGEIAITDMVTFESKLVKCGTGFSTFEYADGRVARYDVKKLMFSFNKQVLIFGTGLANVDVLDTSMWKHIKRIRAEDDNWEYIFDFAFIPKIKSQDFQERTKDVKKRKFSGQERKEIWGQEFCVGMVNSKPMVLSKVLLNL